MIHHFRSMRFAFIGIVLLSGVANLCVPAGMDAFITFSTSKPFLDDVLVGILNGLLIGEFVSLAFWILLEPISFHRKALLGCSFGFFLSTCMIIGAQHWKGMPLAAAILLWVVGILLPFIFAILMLIWSVVNGGMGLPLRLVSRDFRQRQYGIGFLLTSMSVIAIAFAIVRATLPSERHSWLSGLEWMFVGIWFVWLAFASSLLSWVAITVTLRPTLSRIASSVFLTLLGPILFQLLASQILVGKFRINFQIFAPLPHSIAFGLLTAGVILGLVCRIFAEGTLPSSPDAASPSPDSHEPGS